MLSPSARSDANESHMVRDQELCELFLRAGSVRKSSSADSRPRTSEFLIRSVRNGSFTLLDFIQPLLPHAPGIVG